MAQLHPLIQYHDQNPMEVVEQFLSDHNWPCERQGDDELIVGLGGNWCDYQMWFSWRRELSALVLSCLFETKVPPERQSLLHGLIVKLNQRARLGHFDLWDEEGILLFRQSLLLRGNTSVCLEQVEGLIEVALNESERFYPAFQFVLWGGKSVEDAIAASLLDTVGQA